MDLNQLKTFVTVAQTASLTRAASLLFLSQPAISAHIKALETEYSIKLFHRTPRGMELTAAGLTLRDEAQRALDAAQHFSQTAHALHQPPVCHCLIGTIAVPLPFNLPGLLARLRARYQQAHLTLQQSISGTIIDQTINGELDGGFIIGTPDNNPRLGTLPLAPVTLCIAGPGAWKNRLQHATLADLSQLPWITTPEKCAFNTITREFFRQHNTPLPATTTLADQETTLAHLVAMEIGITLMREDLALAGQHERQLYIWPGAKTRRDLSFIWSKSRETSPITTSLIDIIKTLWKITR